MSAAVFGGMLSRPESVENVFLKFFDPKYLEPNALAFEEDQELDARSINHHYEEMHFDFFILNIRSLSKHLIDLNHDMYAQKSFCFLLLQITVNLFLICNYLFYRCGVPSFMETLF